MNIATKCLIIRRNVWKTLVTVTLFVWRLMVKEGRIEISILEVLRFANFILRFTDKTFENLTTLLLRAAHYLHLLSKTTKTLKKASNVLWKLLCIKMYFWIILFECFVFNQKALQNKKYKRDNNKFSWTRTIQNLGK